MNEYYSNTDDWANEYKSIQDNEGEIFYETYEPHIDELFAKANELADNYPILGLTPYNFIWTRIDGYNGKLILVNGRRFINRLDYCLTELPWQGKNGIEDKDVYIEVQYEE